MLIALSGLGSNPAFFFHLCYNIMDRLYFNMYVSLPSGARAINFDTKLHLLPFSLTVKLLTERHLEFLSLAGGCTGSSESILRTYGILM